MHSRDRVLSRMDLVMNCDSARALFDAYWLVAIEAYGDVARDSQPPSSRDRLANHAHRDRCQAFARSIAIDPKMAAVAIGLEVMP